MDWIKVKPLKLAPYKTEAVLLVGGPNMKSINIKIHDAMIQPQEVYQEHQAYKGSRHPPREKPYYGSTYTQNSGKGRKGVGHTMSPNAEYWRTTREQQKSTKRHSSILYFVWSIYLEACHGKKCL
ncbi:hypothetical protein QE152_g8453 [Popillia japonica]|uniref:Uncharacterized protein n=1 Tax=Popillia japonica TaxID=7064 RepID=A0AAW1MA60_POPJA